MGRWIYYTKKFANRWAKESAERGEPVYIALDAMGGDIGPKANLDGALAAVAENPGLRIKLVGRKTELEKAIGKAFLPPEIEIFNAGDSFGMDEPATLALRRPNCSIMVGMNLLAEKKVGAFVSMGNTGAVVASALVKLGKIEGIERPALMTMVPTLENLPTLFF